MPNQTKEESLAQWVAETVEDLYMHSKYGEPQIHILSPPRSTATISVYLNCKNVAGRLFDYARGRDDAQHPEKAWHKMGRFFAMCDAIDDFPSAAFNDTPAAIEALAKTCGWVWIDDTCKEVKDA